MNTFLKTIANEVSAVFPIKEKAQTGRIMVVHEDLDFQQMARTALTNLGYEVDTTADGISAWKEVHLQAYDLIIINHNLQKLTGLQLAYKLRAAEFEFPIILASQTSAPEVMAKNSWLQPAAIIPQPFTLNELVRLVQEYLPRPVNGAPVAAATPFLPEGFWLQQNYRYQ